MSIKIAVGQIIKLRRIEINMNQADLADAIGISRPTLVNIEQGKQNIRIDRLNDIAVALNVSIHELLPRSNAGKELQEIREQHDNLLAAWRKKYTESED